MLWGFTSAEWTAIGTVVLAVVTLVYVLFSYRILKVTRTMAEATTVASQAAVTSAEAAVTSAAAAEAALDYGMTATLQQIGTSTFIEITMGETRLYVHGVRTSMVAYFPAGSEESEIYVGPDDPTPLGRSYPRYMDPRETVRFHAPFGPIDDSKVIIGFTYVRFSLHETTPIREKTVALELPSGETD